MSPKHVLLANGAGMSPANAHYVPLRVGVKVGVCFRVRRWSVSGHRGAWTTPKITVIHLFRQMVSWPRSCCGSVPTPPPGSACSSSRASVETDTTRGSTESGIDRSRPSSSGVCRFGAPGQERCCVVSCVCYDTGILLVRRVERWKIPALTVLACSRIKHENKNAPSYASNGEIDVQFYAKYAHTDTVLSRNVKYARVRWCEICEKSKRVHDERPLCTHVNTSRHCPHRT